jgi:hemoglobin-like flavoprotein
MMTRTRLLNDYTVRFFELDPTPAVFSFGRTVTDINDDAFYQSPGLKRHARHVIHFLDRVMVLLLAMTTCSTTTTTKEGDEDAKEEGDAANDNAQQLLQLQVGDVQEVIRTTLLELGQKHYTYGVTARMYQPMGQALLSTVAELLQNECHEKFTNDYVQAWITVYHALASDLTSAGTSTTTTTTTTATGTGSDNTIR